MLKIIGALFIVAIALAILVPTVFAQQGPELQITNSGPIGDDQPKLDTDSNGNVHMVFVNKELSDCDVRYQTFGGSPNRHAVISWDLPHLNGSEWGTFQAVLYESGTIDINIMDAAVSEYYQITGVNQGTPTANGVSVSGTPVDNSSYRFTWDGISDYNVGTIPYSWIDTSGAGCAGICGDDESSAVPLGFDFTFYSTQYDTAYVSSNGYMSFTDTYPSYYWPPPSFPSGSPAAANVIAPLWSDWYAECDEVRYIYYTMLDTNGNTLIDDTRITNSGSWHKHPDIVVDSQDMVHVVWHDRDNYFDLAYSKIDPSLDDQNGSPANPGSIILVNDIPLMDMNNYSCHPRLAVDSSDNIHCVFEEDGDEVYYTKIDNNGNVLIPVIHIRPCSSWYGLPDLGIDSYDNVHITWADYQDTTEDEVYYMMLNGSNGNMLIDATLMTPNDGSPSKRACIVVDELDMVHLIWQDHGTPTIDAELFYTKFDPYLDDQNGGPSGTPTMTLVNKKMLTTNDGLKSRACQIGINCQNIHVTWYNDQALAAGMNPHYMMLDINGNILTADTALSAAGGASYTSNNMDWMNALEVDSNNKAHIAWCDDRNAYYDIYYTNYQGGTPPGCPPFGESCDTGGTTQNLYMLGEDVYAVGSGFNPNTNVAISVTPDLYWNNCDPIPAVPNSGTTVMTDGAGNIPPTLVWPGSLTVAGQYDLVFEQGGDTLYDHWSDWADNRHDPGFIVQAPEEPETDVGGGGPTVGGEIMMVNKSSLITRWIGLPLRLLLSAAL